MIKKIVKYAAFSLLLLLIGVFAFIINFPVGKLLDKYLTDINKDLGGIQLSFKEAEMGVLGLTVNNLRILSQDEQIDLLVNRVNIALLHYSLLVGKLPISMNLYRGEINGTYDMLNNSANFETHGVKIGEIPMISKAELFNNSPEIDMVGSYNIDTNNYGVNFKTGNVLFNGNNQFIPAEMRSFVPANLNFRSVNGQVNSENNRMTLNVDIQGNFSGKVTGGILVQGNNPQLNISVNGEFDENFKESNKGVYDIINMAYMSGNTLSINIAGTPPNVNVSK